MDELNLISSYVIKYIYYGAHFVFILMIESFIIINTLEKQQ